MNVYYTPGSITGVGNSEMNKTQSILKEKTSPLHTNLQVAKFKRCKCVFPCPIMEDTSETAAYPLSPIADNTAVLQFPTFLVYSLDASPCMPIFTLFYHTFQGTLL